jgi:pimeloyl-ACP methyl ester carboxylesterase
MHKANTDTEDLISRRFLAATQKSPALEILETRAGTETSGIPIVCLHGASGGAWMWEGYLKILAERGRYAVALSLRGHGHSEGYEDVQSATFDDYADDLHRVFAELSEPPILIAHSLGALLAQRLLGRSKMRAAVLMAPLPPEGMGLLSVRLFATMPSGWLDAAKMVIGLTPPVVGPIKDLIFSDRLTPSEIDYLMANMVPESARALTEAHLPQPIMPAFLAGVPTLTIAGELDRLVPREFARRTAVYHLGDYFEAKGLGHLLHVEPKTDDIAHTTIDWLEDKGL